MARTRRSAQVGMDEVEDAAEQGSGEASLGVGVRLNASEFPDLPGWTHRIAGTSSRVHRVPSRTSSQPQWTSQPHWRRTVRLWQRMGHVSPHYVAKARQRTPGRVAVLWDVSGSMTEQLDLYLPWLYILRRKWPRLGVFPFATRMADLTEALRAPYPVARRLLAEIEYLWAGGTNIGWALQEWVRQYGDAWLRGDTVVIILSDGWDVGDPSDTTAALHTIVSRNARVIWANPWMGTPGFEPKTRTLRAARPYLECMVPAGTVVDLLRFANE
ncbi:MAG: VWA domain-containing protein [Alicyclobacillus sp.]|nr:VWA domain-containing protein [Alicyclobacillus sp.]